MKSILFIGLILLSGKSYAEGSDYQSTKDWDHLGTSFGIQTVMFGIYSKGLKLKTKDAVLFSMATTFLGTTLYSLMSKDTNLGRTMGMNMIGAALSVGTCLTFSFGTPPKTINDQMKERYGSNGIPPKFEW